jgi:hypothetical protein
MLFPGVAVAAVPARIPSAAAWAVLNASALASSATAATTSTATASSASALATAADGVSDADTFAADTASVSVRAQTGPVLAHAASFWASLRFGPRAAAPFVDQFRRVPPELQAVLLWLLAFQRKSGGGGKAA